MDWQTSGFQAQMEGDWRSVGGRELEVRFWLKEPELLAFNYVYFPATQPQRGEVRVDGALEAQDTGGADGYFWRDLSAGAHTVTFTFRYLRPPGAVPGDPRPLSAAFTRLEVARMYPGGFQTQEALPVLGGAALWIGGLVGLAFVLGLVPQRQAH